MTVDVWAILEGIRDANFHRNGVRCLRLLGANRETVDELVEDVTRLRSTQPSSRPADSKHVTAWTRPTGRVEQFSLLNASGRTDDYSRDHDCSCFGKRFHNVARYPALAVLAANMPALVNFRVNILGAGAALAAHEEHSVIRAKSGTIGIRARFHLPLATNPAATLVADGDVYHLPSGTIHFVNHGCVHAAANGGDADRVHIVWDMLLTREAANAMFGDGTLLGFNRLADHALEPVGRRTVTRWERLAPMVVERDADRLGFLEVQ